MNKADGVERMPGQRTKQTKEDEKEEESESDGDSTKRTRYRCKHITYKQDTGVNTEPIHVAVTRLLVASGVWEYYICLIYRLLFIQIPPHSLFTPRLHVASPSVLSSSLPIITLSHFHISTEHVSHFRLNHTTHYTLSALVSVLPASHC